MGKFYSDVLTVTKSVPQGSLLGPVFFLLYFKEMVNISSSFTHIMYVDDTALLVSNDNKTELQQVMNRSLFQFQNWGITNRSIINVLPYGYNKPKRFSTCLNSNKKSGA